MNPKDPAEEFAKIRALSPYFARIQSDKDLALEIARMEGQEDNADEYIRKTYGYEIPRMDILSWEGAQALNERVGASATAGFGPKMANVAAAGAVALFTDDSFSDAYATMQQWSEERMQTYQEDNPKMAMAGDFAGGAAGMMAGGAALRGAGGMLARGANSAAAGAVPAASIAGRGLDAMGALGRGMQALPGTLPGQMALGGADAYAYHDNMGGDSPLTAAAAGMFAPAAARGIFSGIKKVTADRAARAAQEAAPPPRPPGGPDGPPPGGPPPGAAPGGPPPGPGGPPPAPTPGGPPPGVLGRMGGAIEEMAMSAERNALKNSPSALATLGHAASAGAKGLLFSGGNPGVAAAAFGGRIGYGAVHKVAGKGVLAPAARQVQKLGQYMQGKPPVNPDIASTVGSKIDDGAARVPTQKTVPWSAAERAAASSEDIARQSAQAEMAVRNAAPDLPRPGPMSPFGQPQASPASASAPRAAPPTPPRQSPIMQTVDAAAERRAVADQIRAERVRQIKDTKSRGLSRAKIEKAVRAEAEAMVKSGELPNEAARKAWVREQIKLRAEAGAEGYKLAKEAK